MIIKPSATLRPQILFSNLIYTQIFSQETACRFLSECVLFWDHSFFEIYLHLEFFARNRQQISRQLCRAAAHTHDNWYRIWVGICYGFCMLCGETVGLTICFLKHVLEAHAC